MRPQPRRHCPDAGTSGARHPDPPTPENGTGCSLAPGRRPPYAGSNPAALRGVQATARRLHGGLEAAGSDPLPRPGTLSPAGRSAGAGSGIDRRPALSQRPAEMRRYADVGRHGGDSHPIRRGSAESHPRPGTAAGRSHRHAFAGSAWTGRSRNRASAATHRVDHAARHRPGRRPYRPIPGLRPDPGGLRPAPGIRPAAGRSLAKARHCRSPIHAPLAWHPARGPERTRHRHLPAGRSAPRPKP